MIKLGRIFFRSGRIPLKINILTLFLSLLFLTALTIVSFTYYKNYKSITRFADETIELASSTIVENVKSLFVSTKELVESSTGWFVIPEDLSWKRPEMPSYLLSVIHYHSRIPFFYVATAQGDYVEAGNLNLSVQTHFFSDPTKPLPKEAVYTMQFFERGGKEKADETVYYYNKDLAVIAKETLALQEYDPRKRAWYLGAKNTGKLFWTDVYRYYDRPDLGFTLSKPLFDPEGNFMGVIAADFSFKLLSEFFSKQQIGKTGHAYILDGKDEILIPWGRDLKEKQLIAEAMKVFATDMDGNFVFEASDRHRYLVHIAPFPIDTGYHWKIAIIVPFTDFFADYDRSNHQVLLIIIAITLLAMLIIVYFAKLISDPIVLLSNEIDRIRQLDLTSENRVDSHIKEIHLIDNSVSSMRHAFRSFVRYVPKEIVKQLLEKQEQIGLGGEKKKIAVFFSDVINFTSISERLPVEELMPLLQEYFEGISKIILNGKGMIDKYMGDGIMAFWGAPLEISDQSTYCCLAALHCKRFLSELNTKRKKEQKPEFYTRIGIDVGTVIVGNIGTNDRMNYTAIGNAVNLASRLEQINKVYHTAIVISECVQQELGDRFLVRPLDDVEIRGKKEKEKIYELVACHEGEEDLLPSERQKELCHRFVESYEAFHEGNEERALELFQALHRDFPEDAPTQIYLERLKH